MEIIPVIDVRGGVAVRAVRGDRGSYQPLATPLASGADPVAVAAGFQSLFPFRTLYVADLDGIEGRGADHALQRRLAAGWLGDEVWVDDGLCGLRTFADSAAAAPMLKSHVLGSEAIGSLEDYGRVRERAGASAVLSLDFRGDTFLGPPSLLEDAELWPERVIVMALGRVGSGEGPDLERLHGVVTRAKRRRIYAAGGVRGREDLVRLAGMGIAGVLVASALHAGQIKTGDLEEVAGL